MSISLMEKKYIGDSGAHSLARLAVRTNKQILAGGMSAAGSLLAFSRASGPGRSVERGRLFPLVALPNVTNMARFWRR